MKYFEYLFKRVNIFDDLVISGVDKVADNFESVIVDIIYVDFLFKFFLESYFKHAFEFFAHGGQNNFVSIENFSFNKKLDIRKFLFITVLKVDVSLGYGT